MKRSFERTVCSFKEPQLNQGHECGEEKKGQQPYQFTKPTVTNVSLVCQRESEQQVKKRKEKNYIQSEHTKKIIFFN